MNRRILLVDDTRSIHEDFRKILSPGGRPSSDLASARAALFGDAPAAPTAETERSYELTSAFQGQEALQRVEEADERGEPFSVAFIDVRMPPGWDGIQTIKELWKTDPDLHCVICTAYSDYSFDETVAELGHTDKLLILKKPFDSAEIRQVASAFTAKWDAASRERDAMSALQLKESEARAYASSLETLNKALATSKASADQMSVMKSEFMLRLTEEVSEHLNAILDRLIEDGRTEGLDEALDRSQRLLETIDKVVDFTHVEAGTLDVHSAPCRLGGIIDDLRATFGYAAAEKGLTLEVHVAESVPPVIQTDAGRLSQILGHIVDNAIRYTEKGGVTLEIATEPADSWDTARLRFDVKDTGRGITRSQVGEVFQPFSTKKEPTLDAGAGLGLTVAKQIARLLGGELDFESDPGEGCTFTLRLQVKRVEQRAA